MPKPGANSSLKSSFLGDWPKPFGLLLSNDWHQTATNELRRRRFHPFAVLLELLEGQEVWGSLYTETSQRHINVVPTRPCWWRSYDERYHSRLSSRFQLEDWSFWSTKRIIHMFQWIISLWRSFNVLSTQRRPQTSQDLPISSKPFLCISLDPTLHLEAKHWRHNACWLGSRIKLPKLVSEKIWRVKFKFVYWLSSNSMKTYENRFWKNQFCQSCGIVSDQRFQEL